MNTDEASAGSTLAARSPSGTSVPAVAATNMLMTIAVPSTTPEHRVAARGPGDQRRHQPERHAVADADERFLQQRLPRVAPGQLAERDAADDDRQRLRAGVAAHAGDDGHEHRQDRQRVDRVR